MDNVRDNPQLPWKYQMLSCNNNLTMEFILENADKKWDWLCVLSHEAITMEHVYNNPQLPWKHRGLSCNTNIRAEYILSNMSKPWNFEVLCVNAGFFVY